jgi:transposase InsO family protein
VQQSLRRLKARDRQREERRRAAVRQHVEVLRRDVLWSQDGTHLGRWLGRGVNAEVVREAATCKTLDLWVLPRATTSEDVIALLEGLLWQGRLPLVLSTDNGSCYCSAEVEAWLAEHGVIHLRSLPHTPQHNAWVERGHGELKGESGLGKGVVLSSVEEAERRILQARELLDEYRLRARLGARTAAEIDRSLPSWEGVLDRRAFYDAVCHAREHAVLGTVGARARRLAQREATWCVLESFGLVRRTRGGAPLPAREAEGIS